MKNLVSAVMVFVFILGSVSAVASAEAPAAKIAAVGVELARIEEVVFQAGSIINFGGTSIFWVLGGGLVAVSLVARRISS